MYPVFRSIVHRFRPISKVTILRTAPINGSSNHFDHCIVAYESSTSSGSQRPGSSGRARRIFIRFISATLVSATAVAGLLYTSEYFRNLLVEDYPSAKPYLDQVGIWIGGWYDEKRKGSPGSVAPEDPVPGTSEEKSTSDLPWQPASSDLPAQEDKKSVGLPTLDDVKQMSRERSRAVPAAVPIEKGMLDATQAVRAARASLAALESATRKHIEGLREAIQFAEPSTSKDRSWERVSRLATLKDKAEAKANAAVEEAENHLEALRSSIDKRLLSEDSIENETLSQGISTHGALKYDLDGSIFEVRKLRNELLMLMRYRDLVAKTHETLQKDLADIREQMDLQKTSKDGNSLSVGELNSLIMVAHSRIGKLQSVITELEEKEKARLNSALESQRRADEDLIADYVKRELAKQKTEHELERLHWSKETQEILEREKLAALKLHSEHLTHTLRLKEEEMEHQFAQRLRETLVQEKVAFEAALFGWTKRMQAIEDVVDGRADLDRIAKETHALWIACEALACFLSSSQPTVTGTTIQHKASTTGPLCDFIDAIKEAAAVGGHPLVTSVLEQIPATVSEKGVWVENGLKERFSKVHKVCRRVALVDEMSGSLWTYALSWLQSVLFIDTFAGKYMTNVPWLRSSNAESVLVGESELNETDLNTFSILRSAKAALMSKPDSLLDEGSLNEVPSVSDDGIELAVRLLGQLRGQAAVVASDWLRDARLYLETKQAARVLLAYAAARGMSTYQRRL